MFLYYLLFGYYYQLVQKSPVGLRYFHRSLAVQIDLNLHRSDWQNIELSSLQDLDHLIQRHLVSINRKAHCHLLDRYQSLHCHHKLYRDL